MPTTGLARDGWYTAAASCLASTHPFPVGATNGEADSDRRETQGTVNEYEILLLLDPEADERRHEDVVARVRQLVESGGGRWDLHDVWGRRKLAYEIGHRSEGVYHLLQFTTDAETLDEISRVLRIDDVVLRHMPTRRFQGGPERPVAVGAQTREDARTASEVEEEEE
jgi:small subunit ribosomal protein S6